MPHSKLKLAVLVSGNGTNLQAILEACRKRKIDAVVSIVISNNPKAFALERAKKFKIATAVVPNTSGAEPEILKTLKQHKPDLICMAGFMRILSPAFLKNFPERVINNKSASRDKVLSATLQMAKTVLHPNSLA